MFGLTDDGDVVRIARNSNDGVTVTLYAHIGGRPLGGAFDKTGDLYVADALKGLLRVKKNN